MGNKVKSEEFFLAYNKVKELNIKAYNRIREEVRFGCTEKELYEKVVDTYLSNTDGKALYTGDYISGKRTCDIEGPATDKVIEMGDTIIVDALCAYDGVYCDTTRTFFCGEPNEEQRTIYTLLCSILDEASKLLVPGVKACEIYNFVDKKVKEAGYNDGLVHHAGHSLGNDWCEEPRLIAENDDILEENMLVALEPGIYLENKFGIRVENNYRVTKNGGVNVFDYTIDIEDFILK